MLKKTRSLLFTLAISISASTSLSANTMGLSQLTQPQQDYLAAKKALDLNKQAEYRKLRKRLQDYPLTLYLDYHDTIEEILASKGSKAQAQLEAFRDSPLYNSGRYRYLKQTGGHARWQDFLVLSPQEPRETQLRCYYYRALLATGESKRAFQGAEKLWLHGKSRPKSCDPLFSAWSKAGHKTQAMIWSRMLLAFESNQYGLLKYLSKKVTRSKPMTKQLLAVYKDPNTLRHVDQFNSTQQLMSELVRVGLKKLARKDLKSAVRLFHRYEQKNRFSKYQSIEVQRYIVRRGLIRKAEEIKSFIDTALPNIQSDDLFEKRIRWAIHEKDKSAQDKFIQLLSEKAKQSHRWQYWQLKNGLINSPESNARQLQQQRNFYGFTAAFQNKQTIQLNHQSNTVDKQVLKQIASDKALSRIQELYAIEKLSEARNEWVLLLRRVTKEQKTQLGLYAQQRQWFDAAVQASIQAKLWGDMQMRFPEAEQKNFLAASKKYKVDIDEIRAIARRESAFFARAQSGVGARGLMQLMPATAKQTAKKNNIHYRTKSQLFNSQLNIQLGSAYYAELLTQFKQNRVLATAAYNAGPHRVKRWLEKSNGTLDVMSFIETIPFKETREYVQAVISYRAIFQKMNGKPVSIFTEDEIRFKY